MIEGEQIAENLLSSTSSDSAPVPPSLQELLDWLNEKFIKFGLSELTVSSPNQLRDGVILVRLLQLLSANSFVGPFVEKPTDLHGLMQNSSLVLRFLQVETLQRLPGCSGADIIQGNLLPLERLLSYIRDQFDLEYLFLKTLHEDSPNADFASDLLSHMEEEALEGDVWELENDSDTDSYDQHDSLFSQPSSSDIESSPAASSSYGFHSPFQFQFSDSDSDSHLSPESQDIISSSPPPSSSPSSELLYTLPSDSHPPHCVSPPISDNSSILFHTDNDNSISLPSSSQLLVNIPSSSSSSSSSSPPPSSSSPLLSQSDQCTFTECVNYVPSSLDTHDDHTTIGVVVSSSSSSFNDSNNDNTISKFIPSSSDLPLNNMDHVPPVDNSVSIPTQLQSSSELLVVGSDQDLQTPSLKTEPTDQCNIDSTVSECESDNLNSPKAASTISSIRLTGSKEEIEQCEKEILESRNAITKLQDSYQEEYANMSVAKQKMKKQYHDLLNSVSALKIEQNEFLMQMSSNRANIKSTSDLLLEELERERTNIPGVLLGLHRLIWFASQRQKEIISNLHLSLEEHDRTTQARQLADSTKISTISHQIVELEHEIKSQNASKSSSTSKFERQLSLLLNAANVLEARLTELSSPYKPPIQSPKEEEKEEEGGEKESHSTQEMLSLDATPSLPSDDNNNIHNTKILESIDKVPLTEQSHLPPNSVSLQQEQEQEQEPKQESKQEQDINSKTDLIQKDAEMNIQNQIDAENQIISQSENHPPSQAITKLKSTSWVSVTSLNPSSDSVRTALKDASTRERVRRAQSVVRQRIMSECLANEQAFVSQLSSFKKYFIVSLQQSSLSEEQLVLSECGIQKLLKFHQAFLTTLETRLTNGNAQADLAE